MQNGREAENMKKANGKSDDRDPWQEQCVEYSSRIEIELPYICMNKTTPQNLSKYSRLWLISDA